MAVQNFGTGGGGFQLSPGINISEVDLTTVTAPVATTIGAIAGAFNWGPVEQRTLVVSENDLVAKFGKPSSDNAETWFTAANFLGYSNALYVSRAVADTDYAAIANVSATAAAAGLTVKNRTDYDAKDGTFNANVAYIAKYPGALGNSLKVSVCDSVNAYSRAVNVATVQANSTVTLAVGSSTALIPAANATATAAIQELFNAGDVIEIGNTSIGTQQIRVNSTSSNATHAILSLAGPLKLAANISQASVTAYWEYYNQFNAAPGTSTYVTQFGNTAAKDEVHLVIVDEDGAITGNPGAVLEKYEGLSRATDAKLADNSTNYYKNVINEQSRYVWWANDLTGATSANSAAVASSTNQTPKSISFQGGATTGESSIAFTNIARAYDLFASAEAVDISLVLTGTSRGGTNGEQSGNYIIDNICEVRKDCVAFISPQKADVVNNYGVEATDIVTFRNSLRSSSFAVCDSGYKYQYDKYNDINRWIPLNGDIAGLCVRTDAERDPWFSPAGFSRGQIKNTIKLAFNPSKAERDLLYKNGVNPVISPPGQGTLLYGDKTLLNKPSAFDRINVRRLFIVLEKAVAAAAKSMMFEINDEFTRTQFRNIVEPFLRDVQGRRGIYDFKVICDETNNTADVIDSNRFVGDIYVKPARAINYIQLNFVAVRSGIEFSEIVG